MIVRRIASTLIAVVTALAACAPLSEDVARYPVLFVHGSGLSRDSWKAMMTHLRRKGYPNDYLLAIDLPRYASNVEAATLYIAPAVEALVEISRTRRRAVGMEAIERVDIVAHSMGAFSSRWYIAKIGPHRIRRFVGLAPANHGSDALCPLAGAGNREMCPAFAKSEQESGVQVALNGVAGSNIDETPWGVGLDSSDRIRVPPDEERRVEYYTVRLEKDPWIVPPESAILDGAGGDARLDASDRTARESSSGNLKLIGDYDHDSLPQSRHVIDVVHRLLSAP